MASSISRPVLSQMKSKIIPNILLIAGIARVIIPPTISMIPVAILSITDIRYEIILSTSDITSSIILVINARMLANTVLNSSNRYFGISANTNVITVNAVGNILRVNSKISTLSVLIENVIVTPPAIPRRKKPMIMTGISKKSDIPSGSNTTVKHDNMPTQNMTASVKSNGPISRPSAARETIKIGIENVRKSGSFLAIIPTATPANPKI